MKQMTYYENRDMKNMRKIGDYLNHLPDYCYDFFTGIENNTSSLTRVNYAMDLKVFYDYLEQYVCRKPKMQITLEDLDNLQARNIENYLSYLSYYQSGETTLKNTERGKARKLASIRSFFKYLFNHDMLNSNVASKVKTPKLHSKEIIRLEKDEVIFKGEIPARCIGEYRNDLNFYTNGRSVCITELKGYQETSGEPVFQPRRPNSRLDKIRHMFQKIM